MNMFIVLIINRNAETSANSWGKYTESLRYSACQFAQKYGWTVHYITAPTQEEAVREALKQYGAIS